MDRQPSFLFTSQDGQTGSTASPRSATSAHPKQEGREGRTELLADVCRRMLEVLGSWPVRHLASGEAGREEAVAESCAGDRGCAADEAWLAEECAREHFAG